MLIAESLTHLPEALAEGLVLSDDRFDQQMLNIGVHVLLPVIICHLHLPTIRYKGHNYVGLPKVCLLLHL